MDQATLACTLGLSKSSISRILSGVQEPKLLVAYDLARALGVTLDYLMEESAEFAPSQHLVTLTDEELMILKIVRRLGPDTAIDRLLNVMEPVYSNELRTAAAMGRGRPEPSSRFDAGREDLSET
jgi:transcriptional regulator with XRE-family HTH domain